MGGRAKSRHGRMKSKNVVWDSVSTDGDDLELTELAKVEAGLVNGVKAVVINRPEDLEAAAGEDTSLLMMRIHKQVALGGARAGIGFGHYLRKLPASARGKVALLFDGWAADPRELHEIDLVVRFCRGLLFGHEEVPDLLHSKEVLEVLLDEHALAFEGEEPVHPIWLDVAGSVWVCSTAFVDEVFVRSSIAPPTVKSPHGRSSGWSRNYWLAHGIREWLAGREGPPPVG